uniref:Putative secreted protein n=1 Tax=Psorophora albipes TaxID=869069 RepID=T1E396_9DIPT
MCVCVWCVFVSFLSPPLLLPSCVSVEPARDPPVKCPLVRPEAHFWDACSQSAACRSLGRAFATCRRHTRTPAPSGRLSSDRSIHGPAVSSSWRSFPAPSAGIESSDVHGPFRYWIVILQEKA